MPLTPEKLKKIKEALETGADNTKTLWWNASDVLRQVLEFEESEIRKAIALIDQALEEHNADLHDRA